MDEKLVKAIIEDFETADIDDRLRATLRAIKALTKSPDEFGPEHIAPALEAGASPEALEEAMMVCFTFSVILRFIDAFGCPSRSPEERARLARALMGLGYSLAAVPGASRPGPRRAYDPPC